MQLILGKLLTYICLAVINLSAQYLEAFVGGISWTQVALLNVVCFSLQITSPHCPGLSTHISILILLSPNLVTMPEISLSLGEGKKRDCTNAEIGAPCF